MPTTFNIGIDWNRDGLICWDAKPGDPLNLLPRPLTWSRLDLGSDGSPTIENQPMIENGKAVTFEATLKPATSTAPVWGVV